MKISLIIILFISSFSFAQEVRKPAFPINEFTLSANKVQYYSATSQIGQFGFGMGLHKFWFEQRKSHLVVGLDYQFLAASSLEGKLKDDPSSSTLTDMKYLYHSINLPVFGRFHFGKEVQFFLEGGVYFGFCLRETVRGLNGGSIEGRSTSPPDDFFRPGGLAGFGVRIPVSSNYFLVKTTYQHSIWNTGIFNLTVGFQIGKKDK